jgi:hypothetical protein
MRIRHAEFSGHLGEDCGQSPFSKAVPQRPQVIAAGKQFKITQSNQGVRFRRGAAFRSGYDEKMRSPAINDVCPRIPGTEYTFKKFKPRR